MGWKSKQGMDLREHPNHRERGPAKYAYTYEDVARIVGLKIGSVYNACSRGEFDIEDLLSVATYICSKRG